MAFTDVEMAILSQLAYMDLERFEGQSLYAVLTDSKINQYLKSSLGKSYTEALSSLTSQVKGGDYTIAAAENNTKSGFAAFAVKDPDNGVTVACRGTELGKMKTEADVALTDVAADVELALSKESAQQADMKAFVDSLERDGYDSYSFTGHSLGGNLAMYGAITLDDPDKLKTCKTFNAPGLNSRVYSENKNAIEKAEKGQKIISYQNSHDGVSEALTVPGKKVILKSRSKSAAGVKGHMLDDLTVEDGGFQKAKPQKKKITVLGSILYVISRLPDSILIIGPSVGRLSATNMRMASGSVASVPVASGSRKIQLSPAELKGLSSEMTSLSDDYGSLFDSVVGDLNRVNDHWSANLSHNFAGKITGAQGRFKQVTEMLASGAAAANLAAVSYEETDSLLAKVMTVNVGEQGGERV